ncbi:hypothetical protein ACHAXS_008532 [Conticribra weissflogii]
MFQLQRTGYMFKNVEHCLSLSQSLASGSGRRNLLLTRMEGGEQWREEKLVNGKIKYAKAYMSELSTRYPTLQGTCCNKTSKGRINLQRFLIVHTHLASTRVEGGD